MDSKRTMNFMLCCNMFLDHWFERVGYDQSCVRHFLNLLHCVFGIVFSQDQAFRSHFHDTHFSDDRADFFGACQWQVASF